MRTEMKTQTNKYLLYIYIYIYIYKVLKSFYNKLLI